MSHVYARGAWHAPPTAHLLFTFQQTPPTQQARNNMKCLKDQGRQGDTYYNEWPVPMYQPSQMPRLSMADHDNIFANDDAIEEEDVLGDGAGAALVSDLGDEVLPFPR